VSFSACNIFSASLTGFWQQIKIVKKEPEDLKSSGSFY